MTGCNNYYHSMDDAAAEIRRRSAHPGLRATVEKHLGDRMPCFFSGQPRALYWPHIASPNTWLLHVTQSAERMDLQPICFEYLTDRFHPGNQTKRHLGDLRFFHGRGRNGGLKTTSIRVVDINEAAGLRLVDVRTIWGEQFVAFHHRLVKKCYPELAVIDMSEWIEGWGSQESFYDAYMSLCVSHCILFENFRPDGCDRELTERVFAPAFDRVSRRFGVKPVIVPLEPLDGPIDLYWYSYPESVKQLVLATLNGKIISGEPQGGGYSPTATRLDQPPP